MMSATSLDTGMWRAVWLALVVKFQTLTQQTLDNSYCDYVYIYVIYMYIMCKFSIVLAVHSNECMFKS